MLLFHTGSLLLSGHTLGIADVGSESSELKALSVTRCLSCAVMRP